MKKLLMFALLPISCIVNASEYAGPYLDTDEPELVGTQKGIKHLSLEDKENISPMRYGQGRFGSQMNIDRPMYLHRKNRPHTFAAQPMDVDVRSKMTTSSPASMDIDTDEDVEMDIDKID